MVTTAELIPTPPLPMEENYCDDCRLCMAACISDFMHPTEKVAISLGGQHFEYASRRSHSRCGCSCGGYTGLHASGKWSTWSPGRFAILKNDKDIPSAYQHMKRAHSKWPDSEGGRYYYYSDEKLRTTCANCQLVCCPDKDERKARYKMLTESGVVVQMSTANAKLFPLKRRKNGSRTCQAPEELSTKTNSKIIKEQTPFNFFPKQPEIEALQIC